MDWVRVSFSTKSLLRTLFAFFLSFSKDCWLLTEELFMNNPYQIEFFSGLKCPELIFSMMDRALCGFEVCSGTICGDDEFLLTLESFTEERKKMFTVLSVFDGGKKKTVHGPSMKRVVEFWSQTRAKKIVFEDSTIWLRSTIELCPSRKVCDFKGKVLGSLGAGWNEDESKFVFIAESFEEDDFQWQGEGLGEGFSTHIPVVMVLDLLQGSLERIATKERENWFPSYPTFDDRGNLFVILTLISSYSPAGVLLCSNRKSGVFRLCFNNSSFLLVDLGLGIRHLSFVKKCKLLVWAAASSEFLHQSSFSIRMVSPTGKKALSYVEGLFEVSLFASMTGVFFTHASKSRKCLGFLDEATGMVLDLSKDNGRSYQILDVFGDVALVVCSDQSKIDVVTTCSTGTSWEVTNVYSSAMQFEQEIVEHSGQHHILYKRSTKSQSPLILFIHGGPHFNYDSGYKRIIDCFLVSEFSVLLVNYKGSTGVTDEEMEELTGNIGNLDLESCLQALEYEDKRHSFGEKFLFGGSHGGYLGALLSLRGDIFTRCCIRNPVTDLALLKETSDIPDWSVVEGMGVSWCLKNMRQKEGEWILPETDDIREKLNSVSPVHILKERKEVIPIPTLIGLGGQDKRVPCSQGKKWYYELRKKNVECKVLLYPDEGHAISNSSKTMIHWWESSIRFMEGGKPK